MTSRDGYGHKQYAEALSEIGDPLSLDRSEGHLLLRRIPGTEWRDAAGCYPLFVCRDWSRLDADFAALGDVAVSAALVADPFGNYAPEALRGLFDVVVPFKEHVVVDFTADWERSLTKHHRYYAKRALREVEVEFVDGDTVLDDWMRLYDALIARHAIEDERRFSRASFARQMEVPGLLVLAARADGHIVGMHLWYVDGDVAYSHLLALDSAGYERMASYALYYSALQHLSGRVSMATLGGEAGTSGNDSSLLRFKRGWSKRTQTAYFCGKIFDRDVYDRLVASRGSDGSFFPAYRDSR